MIANLLGMDVCGFTYYYLRLTTGCYVLYALLGFHCFRRTFFFLRHHCHFVSFKQHELISADNGPDTVQNRYPVDETRLHGHSNPRFVA